MNFRESVVPVIIISLLMVMTGCVAPPEPSSEAPIAFGPSEAILPPQSDPLDAYAQPVETIVALQRAEDILVSRCLDDFGFQDYPQQDYDLIAASFVEAAGRLYGITDRAIAAVYGYHPAPSQDTAAAQFERSEAFDFVFLGLRPGENPAQVDLTMSPGEVGGRAIPPAGCLGQARQQLTGNTTRNPSESATLGRALRIEAWTSAWADSRVVEAKSEWADCMATAGYQVEDPVADTSTREGGAESQPDPSEIAQALTDIDCKVAVDFVARANEVHVEYSMRAIEENQLALQESLQFNEETLFNANQVIQQG